MLLEWKARKKTDQLMFGISFCMHGWLAVMIPGPLKMKALYLFETLGKHYASD
jgi:hypothetical protein